MRLNVKISDLAKKVSSELSLDRPNLLEGTILQDNGDWSYDIEVRGSTYKDVQCCLPHDGIYTEMVGQLVWVYIGTEPMIMGIKYPRAGGAFEGAKRLRRVHGLQL